MSTLLKFIRTLQNGVRDEENDPWSDSANRFRFVKKAEFEVQWMFNNAAIIGNNVPVLKTLNPENIGILTSSKNINNAALSDYGNFYIVSVDLDNLSGGESINIGKAYSDAANPGINAIVLGNGMVTPQEYVLKMTFRDTMNSPIDNFITQWMYYNASPKGILPKTLLDDTSLVGSFEQRLTATLQVRLIRFFETPDCNGTTTSLRKQTFRTYTFEGIFPINIDSPNLTNEENDYITRDVNFSFSRMRLDNNTYTDYAEKEYVVD